MRSRIAFLVLPIALFLSLPCAADPSRDIRVKRDDARDRTWVLRADALYLHEYGSSEPTRRFQIPGWIYVTPRSAGEPDLLVEAGGTVLVTSNIVPKLWRVDAEAAGTTPLELDITPATSRDFGFTGLGFAGYGVLRARSSIDDSQWQIDLARRTATRVP